MAFKHISLLWSAKGVIMGHVGDIAFLSRQKTHITRSHGWYGRKPNYHHIQSTRRSCLWLHIHCQIGKLVRKKHMINRLWYGNFHIITHINPWPISTSGPLALGQIWVSRVDIRGIWKLPYNNLYISSEPLDWSSPYLPWCKILVWSLCCTILTYMSDTEVKVTD